MTYYTGKMKQKTKMKNNRCKPPSIQSTLSLLRSVFKKGALIDVIFFSKKPA